MFIYHVLRAPVFKTPEGAAKIGRAFNFFSSLPAQNRGMRHLALWLFAVVPGLAAVGVSGYYVLQDWASLNRAFSNWERVVRSGGSERALDVAANYESVFRINCFADGVGVLLGAILLAIGIHGLCLLPSKHHLQGAKA